MKVFIIVLTWRIIKLFKEDINYKMASIGAVGMALAVLYKNYQVYQLIDYGAIIKQFFYTLLFGGFFLRKCEKYSVQFSSNIKSLLIAVVRPSIGTIISTFLFHLCLLGTKDPFISTIPTAIFGPSSFVVWSIKTRWNLTIKWVFSGFKFR